MDDYTIGVTVATPYDDTLGRVRDLLAEAGFGILTEIDLAATLRAKLGVDTPSRMILGACRPPLAHAALRADPRVATMLPCNVVVAAAGDGTRVEMFDPALMAELGPALAEVAGEARDRLSGMMRALAGDEEEPDATRA